MRGRELMEWFRAFCVISITLGISVLWPCGNAVAAELPSCLEILKAQGALAPLPVDGAAVVAQAPPGFTPPWGFQLPRRCVVMGMYNDMGRTFFLIGSYHSNTPPFKLPSKLPFDLSSIFRWYPTTGQAILLKQFHDWAIAPFAGGRPYVYDQLATDLPGGTGVKIGGGYTVAAKEPGDYTCTTNFNLEYAIVEPNGTSHLFYLIVKSGRGDWEQSRPCNGTKKDREQQLFQQTYDTRFFHLEDGTFAILGPNYASLEIGARSYVRLTQNFRQQDTLGNSIFILAGGPTESILHSSGSNETRRYQAILGILHDANPEIVGNTSPLCKKHSCANGASK